MIGSYLHISQVKVNIKLKLSQNLDKGLNPAKLRSVSIVDYGLQGVLFYLGPAEKSDSRYGRSFKQLLVLSQPILQSNLRSSARAKKELKGSAAGAQRSLPG